MKKAVKWMAIAIVVAILFISLIAVIIYITNEPLPEGETGEPAAQLTQKMLLATNKQAWDSVGAISWNFADRQTHLWDKKRHLARVRWNEYEVLMDIDDRNTNSIAYKDGVPIDKENQKNRLVDKAWKFWVNDSFWLCAPYKIKDPGTTRTKINLENGSEGLLVNYSAGGATPGDSYLWILDDNGLPVAWKLWVKIVPLKGLQFSWENWLTTPEGAKLAQTHASKVFTLEITGVKTADTPAELNGGKDPFYVLFE